MTTKLCTGPCARELPLSAFHRDPTKRGGRMSRCRDCRSAGDRERRRVVSRARVAATLQESDPVARRRRARVAAELVPPPDPDAPARAARIVALADEALARLAP